MGRPELVDIMDEGYGGGMAGMGHTSARGSESPVATAHSAVAWGKMVVLTCM